MAMSIMASGKLAEESQWILQIASCLFSLSHYHHLLMPFTVKDNNIQPMETGLTSPSLCKNTTQYSRPAEMYSLVVNYEINRLFPAEM